jgi:glycerophosphoryl diester phosphodiesterase
MVYAWTVNNEDDIEAYLALDPPIDGLLTDYPERVTRLLEDRQGAAK